MANLFTQTNVNKWQQIDADGFPVHSGYCKPRYDRIGEKITDVQEILRLSKERKSVAMRTPNKDKNGNLIFTLKPAVRLLMGQFERVLLDFIRGDIYYYEAVCRDGKK